MNEGKKFDSDKLRFSLIPQGTLQPVIRVLEFGARKYSSFSFLKNSEIANKCEDEICKKLRSAVPAEMLERLGLKDFARLVTVNLQEGYQHVPPVLKSNPSLPKTVFVDLVTRKNVLQTDLKNLIESEIIKKCTVNALSSEKKKEKGMQKDERTPIIVQLLKEMLFSETLQNMDYQNPNITICWSEDAKFVEVRKDHILIMTILLGNFEVCFVVSATKGSDCYEMILKLLEAFFNTSLEITDISLTVDGCGNWRKVENAQVRYFDAAHRHLDAYWHGEKTDAETGESHLAHAVCCLMFLLAMESDKKLPKICDHDWQEITANGDAHRTFLCSKCPAQKAVPHGEEMVGS